MAQRVLISDFLNYYSPHAVMTNKAAPNPPPADQWGYAMGADGRVATEDYLLARAKSSYPKDWERYYKDTRKWLGRRVADCNAIAEHFYKTRTGVSIDTKARLNWANWCGVRSKSTPDAKLTGLPQLPGIAVFSGGSSASGITHVGFLFKKYGPGPLDWYVLESRGRNYGLVLTRIKDRTWRYWGKMDKYYEYDLDASWENVPVPAPTPTPTQEREDEMIKRGDKGEHVRVWQSALMANGVKLPKWGADADFGSETEQGTKDFQLSMGLAQTGIVDANTAAAMWQLLLSKTGNTAAVAALEAKIAAAQKALA